MYCTHKIITLIYEGERELAFMHAVLGVFCLLETRYERLNHVSISPFPLADLLVCLFLFVQALLFLLVSMYCDCSSHGVYAGVTML